MDDKEWEEKIDYQLFRNRFWVRKDRNTFAHLTRSSTAIKPELNQTKKKTIQAKIQMIAITSKR